MSLFLVTVIIVLSKNVVTTMDLKFIKAVLCERKCFLRLKLTPNIKVVTFQSVSVMPSKNNEDSFESHPHT